MANNENRKMVNGKWIYADDQGRFPKWVCDKCGEHGNYIETFYVMAIICNDCLGHY